ncbi:hypothetical protein [Roseateles sp.]|uniref:hypothetical protein n=1 Tax=Roseateles sp. TaxID=1971397 RepID=UPI003BADAF66
MPDRTFWLNYWRGIYEVPRAWAMKGENLFHAFEAVAAGSDSGLMQFNMRDQALMLAGMSVEVMMKALIVNDTHSRELVSGVKKPATALENDLVKAFYSHNLVALAAPASVPLSKLQADIAGALSTYIYWRGRYVMPTERGIDDIIPIENDAGLVGPPDRHVSYSEAREVIHYVIATVQARLGNKA